MIRFLALAVLLLVPSVAGAVGPVVGTNCVLSWTAPTANTDGSPLVGAITYKVYVAPGNLAVPPPSATVTVATGTSAPICATLASGQATAWVSTLETPTPGGSVSESVVSAPAPFVLVGPNPPGNVLVR